MIKVAMLATTGERCGIAAYTRALIAGLETLPDVCVTVVPITEGRQPTTHYRAQAERLNAPDVDLVHIQHEHSFWGNLMPRRRLPLEVNAGFWELRYLIQKPVVLTAHTTYSLAEMLKVATERRPHKRFAKQLLVRNTAYRDSIEIAPFTTAITIVHTTAARNALIARGATPNFVPVVPTGIPEPTPSPTDGESFRQKYGLHGRRILTIFGYIAYNKGYELTLAILPELPDDVTLVIAGGARNADMEPYLARLQADIARSNWGDRVLITGYLPEAELAEALAASEIVLTPHTQATGSYSVSFPLAQGRPILASDLDCFRDIAARIDCLELFRAGDRTDYLGKLSALLANPARREQLAAGARKYAARFAWPRVAALTRDVYRDAITIFRDNRHFHG